MELIKKFFGFIFDHLGAVLIGVAIGFFGVLITLINDSEGGRLNDLIAKAQEINIEIEEQFLERKIEESVIMKTSSKEKVKKLLEINEIMEKIKTNIYGIKDKNLLEIEKIKQDNAFTDEFNNYTEMVNAKDASMQAIYNGLE